jgi:hypothetical protein
MNEGEVNYYFNSFFQSKEAYFKKIDAFHGTFVFDDKTSIFDDLIMFRQR